MIFAQSSSTDSIQWVTVGMIVALGVAVFVLMVIGLCMFYYRRERQLLHIERMRAIELGQTLETPEWTRQPQPICTTAFGLRFGSDLVCPVPSFGQRSVQPNQNILQ